MLADKLSKRLDAWVEKTHATLGPESLKYAVALITPYGIHFMVCPTAWVEPGGDERVVGLWDKQRAADMMKMQHEITEKLHSPELASAQWKAMRVIPVCPDDPIETRFPLLEA